MFTKEEVGTVSDAWNVADGYVKLKILSLLVELDRLVKVAIYGSESIEFSLILEEEIKVKSRIEAIKRIIDNLKIIIENTEFALKKPNKEKLKEIEKKLKKVEDVLGGISREETDDVRKIKTLRINESHFKVCLDVLRELKKELNQPLNADGLIFPVSEEIDLDKIKEQLIWSG